jgi:transcriptional regulator with XRE-family HTH domain
MNKLELKKVIKDSGLSREDFANKLEISLSTLNSWEYRASKIPKNKELLIRNVFNLNRNEDSDLPIFKKNGVEVSLDELFSFIIQNEEYILENHKLFRLWISEKVYKGMAKLSTELRSE